MSQYSRAYSEQALKSKLGSLGAIKDLIDAAKRIHALMRDPATPVWVKGVCLAALGYLILPMDAVSDFIPILGHGDDLAMLTAALSAVASHWQNDRPAVVAED